MLTEEKILKGLVFFDLKPIDPSLPEEERMAQLYVAVRQQLIAFKLLVLTTAAQAAILMSSGNPVSHLSRSLWESLISTLEGIENYFKARNLPLPDMREIQKQHAREMLSDPTIPEDQRNELLALLAEDLNDIKAPKPENDIDRWFPAGKSEVLH